ncbi:MAG: EamA/RhaT family transporter [Comamonadaceae bacterium]|nr:EamA/RhaT family transporter [Comamonadaceae bacterium]
MNTPKTPHLLPALAVATTITVWATAFPAIGVALTEMSPPGLASTRFAIAAAFALAWLGHRRPERMPLSDLLVCVLCGCVGAAGYSVLLNMGQTSVSPGAASFLVKTESIWMAMFGVLFLKEAFNRWAWIGTAIGFAGVGVIAYGQPGGIAWGSGAPYVLAAALCSATGFVLQRRLVQRYGALQVSAIMLISAALALLPWLPQGATELGAASGEIWLWVLFLGLLPTLVGQLCWTYAIGQFGAARAGNFLYLVAPLAMGLSWLLSREVAGWNTALGGACVLAGVLLVNMRGQTAMLPKSKSEAA